MEHKHRHTSHEEPGDDGVDREAPNSQRFRSTSVYDVVAGRVGSNGFLRPEQMQSRQTVPLAPEEVLFQRLNGPTDALNALYEAAADWPSRFPRPESELLKATHTYASAFYSAAAPSETSDDFRTLDETALIAVGVLLEEAVRHALGANGDMVFVEPEGLDQGLGETQTTKAQVNGRVRTEPKLIHEAEEKGGDDDSPAKRQKV